MVVAKSNEPCVHWYADKKDKSKEERDFDTVPYPYLYAMLCL